MPFEAKPISNSNNDREEPEESSQAVAQGSDFLFVDDEFPIPKRLAGRIIGNHGCNLRFIRQESNCSVFVRTYGCNGLSRSVHLKGTRESVRKAKEVVMQLLEGQQSFYPQFDSPEFEVNSIEIAIPIDKVDSLLRMEEAELKNIQEKATAILLVKDAQETIPLHRMLKITGPPVNVEFARRLTEKLTGEELPLVKGRKYDDGTAEKGDPLSPLTLELKDEPSPACLPHEDTSSLLQIYEDYNVPKKPATDAASGMGRTGVSGTLPVQKTFQGMQLIPLLQPPGSYQAVVPPRPFSVAGATPVLQSSGMVGAPPSRQPFRIADAPSPRPFCAVKGIRLVQPPGTPDITCASDIPPLHSFSTVQEVPSFSNLNTVQRQRLPNSSEGSFALQPFAASNHVPVQNRFATSELSVQQSSQNFSIVASQIPFMDPNHIPVQRFQLPSSEETHPQISSNTVLQLYPSAAANRAPMPYALMQQTFGDFAQQPLGEFNHGYLQQSSRGFGGNSESQLLTNSNLHPEQQQQFRHAYPRQMLQPWGTTNAVFNQQPTGVFGNPLPDQRCRSSKGDQISGASNVLSTMKICDDQSNEFSLQKSSENLKQGEQTPPVVSDANKKISSGKSSLRRTERAPRFLTNRQVAVRPQANEFVSVMPQFETVSAVPLSQPGVPQPLETSDIVNQPITLRTIETDAASAPQLIPSLFMPYQEGVPVAIYAPQHGSGVSPLFYHQQWGNLFFVPETPSWGSHYAAVCTMPSSVPNVFWQQQVQLNTAPSTQNAFLATSELSGMPQQLQRARFIRPHL